MATYASTTNPFIETNEGSSSKPPSPTRTQNTALANNEGQAGKRKSLPGMARPQKSINVISKEQSLITNEVNLMLDELVPAGKKPEATDLGRLLDANNNDSLHISDKQEPGEGTPASTNLGGPTERLTLVDEDTDLEVNLTCNTLVEQVALMSMTDGIGPNNRKCEEPLPASVECKVNTDVAVEYSGERDIEITPSKSILRRTSESIEEDEEDDSLACTTGTSDKKGVKETKSVPLDSRQHQHIELMKKLRLQLRDLERYAYERGELEQVPSSILAERQSVILDKLRKRLSLNLDKDKIEKMELEELKRQVDEEINALIDPLITKEHLLNQLKTQLTDLERYITHLHEAIGKGTNDKSNDCSCSLHGCSSSVSSSSASSSASSTYSHSPASTDRSVLNSSTLPKTSRLIRGLMAQLICSDMKIQEAMKLESEFAKAKKGSSKCASNHCESTHRQAVKMDGSATNPITKPPQFHDNAAWTLHIDRVILAADSLSNLFSLTPKKKQKSDAIQPENNAANHLVDESLVESVVRRQLVPAMRDLLAYGLIDPSSIPQRSSYVPFFIDPYYLFTSFSCLPGVKSEPSEQTLPTEKVHIWNVILDYYESRNEVNFRTSSIKTLSQSFNLTPSMEGPIKITSKQALLIAIDDIISQLARRKPNGPESHFRLFVYTALNQGKLATWIRIIFRNKSVLKKYYHDFSFASQAEKMDRFLATIEVLSQFTFTISTDTDTTDQFVSAF